MVMASTAKSLHVMIDHWLAPDPGAAVRVKRLGGANRRCAVYVEVRRHNEPVAMHFFRHDNGNWCIFPPDAARPTMSICRSDGEKQGATGVQMPVSN
jgi:hypothetical protein